MKKIKTLAAATLLLMVVATACNNSGNSETTNTDTATQGNDTIQSDPAKFSDPH